MADIFLSYAREDLTQAKVLAAELENRGWTVFWDRTHVLAGQDIDEVIEQAIEQASCMIVAWSEAAKKSDWVRGEATIGRERRILVPIRFESVSPPIAFRSIHTDDFVNWKGDTDSDSFQKLLLSVIRLAGSPIANNDQAPSAQTKGTGSTKASKPTSSGSKSLNKSSPAYIEPEMVDIPAESFQMGEEFNKYLKHVHKVTFAQPFSIAKNVVTFEQYDLFAKACKRSVPDDENGGRDQRPVINVSWEDASAYASWLSKLSGKYYRLPSEAEWEYAVQALIIYNYYWNGLDKAKNFAWYSIYSKGNLQPVVAIKKLKTFGITAPQSGNVWEWVQDGWHDNYQNAPIDGSAWESESDSRRVLRGGSWDGRLVHLRSAFRYGGTPGSRYSNIGFRLAQD